MHIKKIVTALRGDNAQALAQALDYIRYNKTDETLLQLWPDIAGILKNEEKPLNRFFNALIANTNHLHPIQDVILWMHCLNACELSTSLHTETIEYILDAAFKAAAYQVKHEPFQARALAPESAALSNAFAENIAVTNRLTDKLLNLLAEKAMQTYPLLTIGLLRGTITAAQTQHLVQQSKIISDILQAPALHRNPRFKDQLRDLLSATLIQRIHEGQMPVVLGFLKTLLLAEPDNTGQANAAPPQSAVERLVYLIPPDYPLKQFAAGILESITSKLTADQLNADFLQFLVVFIKSAGEPLRRSAFPLLRTALYRLEQNKTLDAGISFLLAQCEQESAYVRHVILQSFMIHLSSHHNKALFTATLVHLETFVASNHVDFKQYAAHLFLEMFSRYGIDYATKNHLRLLTDLLKSDDQETISTAAHALISILKSRGKYFKLNKFAWASLATLLDSKDEPIRRAVLQAIASAAGYIGKRKLTNHIAEFIKKALSDQYPNVRVLGALLAVGAISGHQDPELNNAIKPFLQTIAQDQTIQVRQQATALLQILYFYGNQNGMHISKTHAALLMRLCLDENSNISRRATAIMHTALQHSTDKLFSDLWLPLLLDNSHKLTATNLGVLKPALAQHIESLPANQTDLLNTMFRQTNGFHLPAVSVDANGVIQNIEQPELPDSSGARRNTPLLAPLLSAGMTHVYRQLQMLYQFHSGVIQDFWATVTGMAAGGEFDGEDYFFDACSDLTEPTSLAVNVTPQNSTSSYYEAQFYDCRTGQDDAVMLANQTDTCRVGVELHGAEGKSPAYDPNTNFIYHLADVFIAGSDTCSTRQIEIAKDAIASMLPNYQDALFYEALQNHMRNALNDGVSSASITGFLLFVKDYLEIKGFSEAQATCIMKLTNHMMSAVFIAYAAAETGDFVAALMPLATATATYHLLRASGSVSESQAVIASSLTSFTSVALVTGDLVRTATRMVASFAGSYIGAEVERSVVNQMLK